MLHCAKLGTKGVKEVKIYLFNQKMVSYIESTILALFNSAALCQFTKSNISLETHSFFFGSPRSEKKKADRFIGTFYDYNFLQISFTK